MTRRIQLVILTATRFVGNLTIRFPYSATGGLKRVGVTLDVEAQQGRRIEMPAFVYLSLEDITFDPIHTIGPDGDLIVQVVVINYGDRPLSFRCFAEVAGRARQSSIVEDLPPAAKAEKIFRFGNGTDLLGESLRSGLRQIDGNAVLNHAAEIR